MSRVNIKICLIKGYKNGVKGYNSAELLTIGVKICYNTMNIME